jgi:transposase InsO family protein
MEHVSRRLVHCNVTAHPTSQWTLQQLREAIPSDHEYRYLIHDRDSIFSADLDGSIRNLGLRVLKTPYRSPQANALCERLIGSLRRECLDFVIPLSEGHLRKVLVHWRRHYNTGRPYMSLAANVPAPPPNIPVQLQPSRHLVPDSQTVISVPLLNGLHHQ